jgi:putative endonuclease
MTPRPGRRAPPWFVYLVRCRDGSLYTGVASDVERRLREHSEGGRRGARYLRGRGPLRLVFRLAVGNRGRALRVERRIKRLPKAGKERLARGGAPSLLSAILKGR